MPEQIQTPPKEFSEESEETPEITPELRFYNDFCDLKTYYVSAVRWTATKKIHPNDPETAEAAERNIALCRKEFAEMMEEMRKNSCFAQVSQEMELLAKMMATAQFEGKEESEEFDKIFDPIDKRFEKFVRE